MPVQNTMAEFLVSLNPANWPEGSIPLRHTLIFKNDTFHHSHVHRVSFNINVSDNFLKLIRELRWWVVFGTIGFVAWKGWKTWLLLKRDEGMKEVD
ncbi:hypothetical protein TWF788_003947 [Orbilia oligospora]|uniref:Uncharacterized protein n=1 Tax=Orbilia oligospora TaxID=2813651 RepID=A0A7C8P7F4_ORBOL|nr:hypothetical protein TWF788_003947 [Orbilia oligospora]KAF3198531.1 hypothetical protein TWF679_002015 [Orbilia oligospora]KAF3230786.1 hypothetical protein TWF191_011428 [Orbilia oligospora]